MPTVSTSPPKSEGAMLSTCSAPLATASPAMANFSSSSGPHGRASSALAATTAATAEAAEPPRPEPSGIPLSISTSKPKPGRSASCSASSARPAVFSRWCARQMSWRPRAPHESRPPLRLDGSRSPDPRARRRQSRGCRSRSRRCRPRPARRRSRAAAVPWRSQPRPEVGRQPQQIREHAAGGDFRTRARALHDERIVAVAARGKAHHVIGQGDVGERVRGLELLAARPSPPRPR